MRLIGLFLNNCIRTGGHRRFIELLEDLAQRGHNVSVIMNEDLPYTPENIIPRRIACAYNKGFLTPVSISFKRAVKRLIEQDPAFFGGADLLHIHGETHLASAVFIKKRYGIPFMYAHRSNTVREVLVAMADRSVSPFRRFFLIIDLLRYRINERTIAAQADSIVFQSPYDMGDFCARNPGARGKSVIIRGNIGLPRFRKETESTNNSSSLRKILFIGKLGNRKGVRHLLVAMDILARRGITDITLDVIGPLNAGNPLVQWVAKRDLGNRVFFHGRVNDPFVFLSKSDLLVVPSDFDSYPDTVLEGLHVGIPVIGSTAGGIPDMLNSPDLLFPVQNPAAIADLIERLYRDNSFYLRARNICADRRDFFHFDWAAEWEKHMSATAARR